MFYNLCVLEGKKPVNMRGTDVQIPWATSGPSTENQALMQISSSASLHELARDIFI